MRRLMPLRVAAAVVLLGTPLVTVGLLTTVYSVMYVPIGAMHPTIPLGSYVLVNRLEQDPIAGELILYRQDSRTNLKRVIATGGHTVACCKGDAVMVDSQSLDESYLSTHDTTRWGPVTVPPDRLWVLGDNRMKSLDSRAYIEDPHQGTIAVSDVFGTTAGASTRAAAYGDVMLQALLGCLPAAVIVGAVVARATRRTLVRP